MAVPNGHIWDSNALYSLQMICPSDIRIALRPIVKGMLLKRMQSHAFLILNTFGAAIHAIVCSLWNWQLCEKKKKRVQLLDVCYICIVLADTGVLNEQYFKTDMEMEPVERERKNRDFNSPWGIWLRVLLLFYCHISSQNIYLYSLKSPLKRLQLLLCVGKSSRGW